MLNTTRALKFRAAVPTKYWGCCVLAACYLISLLPSSVLGGKSPFDVLFDKLSDLSHLQVFGCLCFATKVGMSDKYVERVIPIVMMGYSKIQKGYKLLSIQHSHFFISKDVVFRESVFSFTMLRQHVLS